MSSRTRLSDKDMKALEAPEKGNRIVWDSQGSDPVTERRGKRDNGPVSGFGVRITAKGAKAYILEYRFHDEADANERRSSKYRFTIGSASNWTLTAAREEARAWLQKIDRGETHPLAERRGKQQAVVAAREAETFEQAVTDYIKRYQIGEKQNATAEETKRVLLNEGARAGWNDKPLSGITPQEVQRQLEIVRDGDEGEGLKARPYLSNRFHAHMVTFFSWCARPSIAKVATSPMTGIPAPFGGEKSRDRVFNDDEIKALWNAADAIGGTAGAFLKVVMITGKRKNAVAGMRWGEVDQTWLWTPPKDTRRRRGNKRTHAIPLPKLAQRILTGIKPRDTTAETFVFPGRRKGTSLDPGTPLQKKIQSQSGIGDFFFHACRHTVETRMAELGVMPHVRDMLLDHAPSRGAGQGYDHHAYRDEMLAALETWAGHIEKLVAADGVAVLR